VDKLQILDRDYHLPRKKNKLLINYRKTIYHIIEKCMNKTISIFFNKCITLKYEIRYMKLIFEKIIYCCFEYSKVITNIFFNKFIFFLLKLYIIIFLNYSFLFFFTFGIKLVGERTSSIQT